MDWTGTVFFFFLTFRDLFLLEVKAQGKNVFTNGFVLPDLSLFINISYGSTFSGFVIKRGINKSKKNKNLDFFLDVYLK